MNSPFVWFPQLRRACTCGREEAAEVHQAIARWLGPGSADFFRSGNLRFLQHHKLLQLQIIVVLLCSLLLQQGMIARMQLYKLQMPSSVCGTFCTCRLAFAAASTSALPPRRRLLPQPGAHVLHVVQTCFWEGWIQALQNHRPWLGFSNSLPPDPSFILAHSQSCANQPQWSFLLGG